MEAIVVTRQQQLSSDDIQTALAILWAACGVKINRWRDTEWKMVVNGVLLWHEGGMYWLEAQE